MDLCFWVFPARAKALEIPQIDVESCHTQDR